MDDQAEIGASASPFRRLFAVGVVLYPARGDATFHGTIPARVIGAEPLRRGFGRVFATGLALDIPVSVAARVARALEGPDGDAPPRPAAPQN